MSQGVAWAIVTLLIWAKTSRGHAGQSRDDLEKRRTARCTDEKRAAHRRNEPRSQAKYFTNKCFAMLVVMDDANHTAITVPLCEWVRIGGLAEPRGHASARPCELTNFVATCPYTSCLSKNRRRKEMSTSDSGGMDCQLGSHVSRVVPETQRRPLPLHVWHHEISAHQTSELRFFEAYSHIPFGVVAPTLAFLTISTVSTRRHPRAKWSILFATF